MAFPADIPRPEFAETLVPSFDKRYTFPEAPYPPLWVRFRAIPFPGTSLRHISTDQQALETEAFWLASL
jgi:hypothetical protein